MGITYHKHGLTDAKYNAWRNSLPEHCWTCCNFDKCGPNHPCKYNPSRRDRKKKRRSADV